MNLTMINIGILVITLFASVTQAKVVAFDKEKQQEFLQKKGLVIIDFYADWCTPCKQMAPVFEELSEKKNECLCVKVNIDQAPELAMYFGIKSIPTILILKDGEKKGSIVGIKSVAQLEEEINLVTQEKGLEALSVEQLQQRMLQAIMNFDLDAVCQIAAVKKFDINAPFTDGNNPLGYAVIFGAQAGTLGVDMINVLLKLGADPIYELQVGSQSMSVLDLSQQMLENAKKSITAQEEIVCIMQKHIETRGKAKTESIKKSIDTN